MNLIQAQKQLRYLREAGNAALLTGGSGLGKSSIAVAEFETFRKEHVSKGRTVGLGTIFAATQTPPDLIGYQFKGERSYPVFHKDGTPVILANPDGTPRKNSDGTEMQKMHTVTITDPSVPLWMLSVPYAHGKPSDPDFYFDPGGKPASMYDLFYLIIDEYGQGEADVKRAMAEIFLKGGTAPWYLPPGSVRVACTNEGSRYGVTKDFDFCVSRRTKLPIVGDIKVTLAYMDRPYEHNGRIWQTLPVTKAWAEVHPETVFEKEPEQQGPWCMPRTLCDADRFMQVAAADNNGDIPVDDPWFQETMSGIIGVPAMTSLVSHLQFRTQLPSFDDVVKDPDNTPVPTKADLQMLMAYECAGWCAADDAQLGPAIRYINRLPKDMGITFITALLRRDYRGIINLASMQGWISKNASLVSVISQLSQM